MLNAIALHSNYNNTSIDMWDLTMNSLGPENRWTASHELLSQGDFLWTKVDSLHHVFSLGDPNYAGEVGHMARLYSETSHDLPLYPVSIFFHLKVLEQRVLGCEWLWAIIFICTFLNHESLWMREVGVYFSQSSSNEFVVTLELFGLHLLSYCTLSFRTNHTGKHTHSIDITLFGITLCGKFLHAFV